MPRKNDEEFVLDWYVVNLKTGEISLTLSRMPPAARDCSTAVSCRNHINVLGGACWKGPTCPDGEIDKFHMHDYVFHFDREHPEIGWTRASPMLLKRMKPGAVVLREDLRFWRICLSDPVLVDSSRSRILVHFACNRSLYAYYVDDKSRECLNENFGEWSTESVIVDDVLYSLFEGREDIYCFSAMECSLRAYDVVENKQLPTKWSSEFQICASNLADLFHLGNGKLCLAWYTKLGMLYAYVISVSKNSGEIHATGESESVTCIPFEIGYCLISLL
ncbi:hypothetical protein DITRI_Ditri02bG0156800 [Diplodiscus trichospermus]